MDLHGGLDIVYTMRLVQIWYHASQGSTFTTLAQSVLENESAVELSIKKYRDGHWHDVLLPRVNDRCSAEIPPPTPALRPSSWFPPLLSLVATTHRQKLI